MSKNFGRSRTRRTGIRLARSKLEADTEHSVIWPPATRLPSGRHAPPVGRDRAAAPIKRSGALRRLNHAPEALAAMALACLYLALMSGHLYSIDGLLMYHQALSLAYARALHLAPPVLWGAKITTSKYGLGLSLLYLPGLLLWSWLAPSVPQSGTNPYNWAMLNQDPLYTVAGAPIQVLVAATSAYLVARLLRELGFGPVVALWGLALYGLQSSAGQFSIRSHLTAASRSTSMSGDT